MWADYFEAIFHHIPSDAHYKLDWVVPSVDSTYPEHPFCCESDIPDLIPVVAKELVTIVWEEIKQR